MSRGAAVLVAFASAALLGCCRAALGFVVPRAQRGPPAASPLLRASGNLAGGVFAPVDAAAVNQESTISTAAAAVALLGVAGCCLAARRSTQRRARSACKAFGFSSSGSGFHGSPDISSFQPYAAPDDYESRQGAASMGMKNQVWWVTSNGFDWRGGGKIFDSRRRESRRRGEELFRHDIDNFELTLSNLIGAPGSHKKKVVRGRGKYGSHGRTCGYGNGGAHKRGRRTINPHYESGNVPMYLTTPKLNQEQLDSMKKEPFTLVELAHLNMCDDGDEVDYLDLYARGIPVPGRKRLGRTKIKGDEDDEFTVKNLTVYAHAFEPAAREKIEKNGGKCIRLHDWANIPIDADYRTPVAAGGAPAEDSSADEA